MSLDVVNIVSTESKDSIAGGKRYKVDSSVEIEILEMFILMAYRSVLGRMELIPL